MRPDIDQIEEVDIYGEDDDFVLFNTQSEKIEHEIVKIGQPWNRPIDLMDATADEKIKKQGEEARRLQQLREALAKLQK